MKCPNCGSGDLAPAWGKDNPARLCMNCWDTIDPQNDNQQLPLPADHENLKLLILYLKEAYGSVCAEWRGDGLVRVYAPGNRIYCQGKYSAKHDSSND
jgi:hypothetical protein